MGRHVVPSLKCLAFMVSYEDMFTNLGLYRDFVKGKQLDGSDEAPVSEIPFYSSLDSTISYITARFSQHLVGIMNDEIKKMYLKKFYETLQEVLSRFTKVECFLSGDSTRIATKKKEYWESFYESSTINAWTLLDCVLDEHFKELEIYATLPFEDPDPKLITNIAARSSDMEKLKLDFSFIENNLNSIDSANFNHLVLGLSSLQHLTNLSLHGLADKNVDVNLLCKSVAKSCPRLSYLSIRDCSFVKKDVLSLIIIGELVDPMFESHLSSYRKKTNWSVDEILASLRVPPEYLTPMCFTLQHLDIENSNWRDCFDSTLAFALRHLPVLQQLVCDTSEVVAAVKIFHETSRMEEFQNEFEELCRDVVGSSEKPNSPILQTERAMLSLTSLKGVDVSNKALLDIIGKRCPFLKDVTFREEELPLLIMFNKILNKPELNEEEVLNSFIDDIESILSEWPKLESVTFHCLSQENKLRDVLLRVFGKDLQQLTFEGCKDINLEDLLPYHQLESLCILSPFDSTISSPNSRIDLLASKQFLPQLKSLESNICLGSTWSRVFEDKSTLTSVIVSCLHIGTEASSHSDWSSIPMMWPNLEILHIPQCDGLTMEIVLDLLPQLDRLRAFHLPNELKSPAEVLNCYYPPSPIKFKACLHDEKRCIFLAPKDTPCICDESNYWGDEWWLECDFDDDNDDLVIDYEDYSLYDFT